MFYIAITADVDPDANCAAEGRPDARTAGSQRIYVNGCRQGLATFLDILKSLGLPATFFWEARTLRLLSRTSPRMVSRAIDNTAHEHGCHGMRHIDFAGVETGILPSADRVRDLISRAKDIVENITGQNPAGFRSPYCRLTNAVLSAIRELAYRYDASETLRPGEDWDMHPFPLSGPANGKSLWELPLTISRDQNGRLMSGYMWRLLENSRPPKDYIALATDLENSFPDGLLQFALHPWHFAVMEDGSPHTDQNEAKKNVRQVLSKLKKRAGIRFVTLSDYLSDVQSASPESPPPTTE